MREGNDKGDDANQKIHSFFQYAYRAERYRMTAEEYIFKVNLESEENSSRDCSICKERHRNGRKYRGLYHCRRYDVIMNADVNASENLLNGRKVSPGPIRLPAKADSACGRVSQRGEGRSSWAVTGPTVPQRWNQSSNRWEPRISLPSRGRVSRQSLQPTREASK